MIEIVNLHKRFDSQEVLRGVNLKINKGQTFALIGSSGKGKSVLLKHIIGLLKPNEGQVFVDNKNIGNLRGRKLKKLKDRIGVVFQGGALFDSLTVFDNIAFPLREKTKLSSKQIKEEVLKELSKVGLEEKETLNKYPAQISGGMRKRVALARCLVMDPEIILFDEPTTGLDPIAVKNIHNLIKKLQKERELTALIVSHEIPEIFEIADKVAMLYQGKIITVGTPEEIVNSENSIVQSFIRKKLEEIFSYYELKKNVKGGLDEKS